MSRRGAGPLRFDEMGRPMTLFWQNRRAGFCGSLSSGRVDSPGCVHRSGGVVEYLYRRCGFEYGDDCRAVVALLTHRSEEHTSELQSLRHLVCRLLLEKKNNR